MAGKGRRLVSKKPSAIFSLREERAAGRSSQGSKCGPGPHLRIRGGKKGRTTARRAFLGVGLRGGKKEVFLSSVCGEIVIAEHPIREGEKRLNGRLDPLGHSAIRRIREKSSHDRELKGEPDGRDRRKTATGA